MIDKYRDKLDEKGVSPVIGVILLVAVTVALVALATVIVFDIVSGGVSDTADASVEMEQTDSGVKANIFSNENVEEFILKHEDGTEQRSTQSIGSFTYDNGNGEYTLIAVVGGNKEVIDSKTVVGAESGETPSDTADASVQMEQTDSGVKATILRNGNVDEFILRHEDGNEKRSTESFTYDNGNGEYTLIAVVGGNEVVIDSKTVVTADATVDIQETSTGISVDVIRNENIDELRVVSPDGSSQTFDSDVGSSHTIEDGEGSYSIVATLEDGSEETIRTITSSDDSSSGTVSYNSPVEGVLVESYDSEGDIVDSDLTNANGVYTVKEADELRVNGFTTSYGDVNLCTVASNEGTSVPSLLMDGNGTSSSPYEISTASDLQAMQEDLNDNYIVVNDINASCTVNWNNGQGFDPIGEWDVRFAGSLDGQNHTISDLSINRLDDNEVGLFGYISEGGEVKNVGVINVNINGDEKVGGLVGRNYGTVSNSYSTGNVTGKKLVGGLVGENYNGNISNSYSTGNVTGEGEVGEGEVGGLVGQNWGTVSNSYSTGNVTGEKLVGGLVGNNGNATISNSYSTGNVTGGYDVGGLVGYDDEGNISNSYSTGNVTGESNVGGLVGDIYKGNISNSYSTGNVTGGIRVGGLVGENSGTTVSNSYSTGNVSGDNRVGGLVGDNSGTVSNSYSTGNVIGESFDVGGLVGDNEGTVSNSNGLTTSEMQGSSASSSMSGFDFTDTWSTVEGDYPELQWQE